MKTANYSFGNRLLALLLSVIMVLGMLPTSVIAEGSTNSSLENVEALVSGFTFTKNDGVITATFAGELDWVKKEPDIGRTVDGWWAGIKVNAPETLVLDKAQFTNNSDEILSFNKSKDSADGAEQHYITLWALANEEKMRTANLESDGLFTYTYTFDWDGDGEFEQTVKLQYDAKKVTLNKDGAQVYPAANTAYGKVENLTEGATVSGSETGVSTVAFDKPFSVAWFPKTESIGRYQDGWWVGVRVTAPDGVDLNNASFKSSTQTCSFSEAADAEGSRIMSIWVPLNEINTNGTMADRTVSYDWNGDGLFEQTLTVSVDPSKAVLTQNGKMVYPKNGTVTCYQADSTITETTDSVAVHINHATLDWVDANTQIGRNERGWWVGILVNAPALDSSVLKNAKFRVKDKEEDDWGEPNSFWQYKDSADGDSAHNIQLWRAVKADTVGRWYCFDWDGNGTYDQTITFTFDYNGITRNKRAQTDFAFATESPDDLFLGDGDTYQNIASGGQTDGSVTYKITKGADVASVDANKGTLTFAKAGKVTVQATKAGDDYYEEATATYTITAKQSTDTPSFQTSNPTPITYAPNLTYTNSLVNVEDSDEATITYSIIDEDENGANVATIDAETGELTILKAGTVTIQASIGGRTAYADTTVAYTLTVEKASQPDFEFDNPVVTVAWKSEPLDALTLKSGLGTGTVEWKIKNGDDVASIDTDGKITLLKAGSFTVTAQKKGDSCYEDSDVIEHTITVSKANQIGFGFQIATDTITYNDIDKNGGENAEKNKYTLIADGGQTNGDISFEITEDAENKDVATLENGVLTILKAGTVTVKATKAYDERYNEATAQFTLTINKADRDVRFENKAVDVLYYGTTEYTNAAKLPEDYDGNREISYSISENTIGATIDAGSGKVTFADSEEKVGRATVTATIAEDDRYNRSEISYTLTVSYWNMEEGVAPTVSGDQKIKGSAWYTGNVKINAPENYKISYSNAFSNSTWAESVSVSGDGANQTKTVYLKNADGYITDAIEVSGIYLDATAPTDLEISYQEPTWKLLLENLTYGIYKNDVTKLLVTVSAKDETSGIDKLVYSCGGGDVEILKNGAKDASHSFEINADFRYLITLKAVDVAGNSTEIDSEGGTIVLDGTVPEIGPEYTFEKGLHEHTGYDEIYYTQGDVGVTFTITEANFDLRGMEISGGDGATTGVPVVKVDGIEQTVTWTQTEGTDEWTCSEVTISGEGDHFVTVEYTDPSENKMETYTKEIHIDATKPEIEVTYDNNDVRNGNCYNNDRTATIKITEHNFRADEVVLTVTATDIQGNTVDVSGKGYADYAQNPDNWTMTETSDGKEVYTLNTDGMKFDTDAIYTLTVNCTDLAGNAAETKNDNFVIDHVAPTVTKIEYTESVGEQVLNAITCGLYQIFKDTVTVKVTVEDQTAGVESVTLRYAREADASTVNTEEITTDPLAVTQDEAQLNVFTATYTISAQARGNVTATAIDKAGNDENVSNSAKYEDERIIVVDNTAPIIAPEYTFEKGLHEHTGYDEIYYTQGDVGVTFTITEANFDLRGMEISGGDGATTGVPVVKVDGIEQTVTWTQTEGTDEWTCSEVTIFGEGDHFVTVEYTDPSENKMETYTKEIHIDATKPEIEVTYDNNDARNENNYKADRTATIKITEHNFRADEVVLTVTAKDIQGNTVDVSDKGYAAYAKNRDNWTMTGTSDGKEVYTLNTKGMKFDTDAIYTLTVNYTDLAGNVADSVSDNFVIDHVAPTGLTISYSEPIVEKIVETLTFGFYKAKMTVTLTADDITSGVDFFEWSYAQQKNTSKENTDKLEGKLEAKDIAYSNRGKTATASFEIPAQARGSVTATVTDRAGNNDQKTDSEHIVVVDTIDPTREVSYSTPDKIVNAETMLDVDSYAEGDNAILYYQKEVTVTFQIKEANFDLSLSGNAAPKITVNDEVKDVTWAKGANDVWTATHTISGNGDYVVKMTYQDLSTNEMKEYTSCPIHIDGTPAAIALSYDNNDARNENNYKADRTATIEITEHNFRADEVVLTVTAKDIQGNDVTVSDYATYAKTRKNWTHEGDVHTLKVNFTTDAIYDIKIGYTDLSGNAAESVSDNFVIDHNAPTSLTISYSESIVEKVVETLTFGFYQAKVTVTLTADDITSGVDFFEWSYAQQKNTSKENTEKLEGKLEAKDIAYSNGGKTATASFEIPAQARGSVTATVTDRAGNNDQKTDSSHVVVVDKLNPKVSVTYTPNSEKTVVQFTDKNGKTVEKFDNAVNAFYNGDVTAKITVKEANFFEGVAADDGVIHNVGIKLTRTDDDGNVTVTEYLPKDAEQTYKDVTSVERVDWLETGNPDEYYITVPYGNDGDYVLEIEYSDLSGNKASISADDGRNTTMSYTSKIVTVDKTAPVINVIYSDGKSVHTIDGRDYFDRTRGASISITEHNFRASDVAAVVSAVDFVGNDVVVRDYAEQLSNEANWTHNGNVHTATIEYTVDANYTFHIGFTDLAQNVSANREDDEFTVDTKAPTNLTISYSTSVFQEILESITFGYYNAKMKVTITARDVTSGVRYFRYSYTNSENVSSVNQELLDQRLSNASIQYNGATATASFEIPKLMLDDEHQFNGTVSFVAYDCSENSTGKDDTARIVVDNISPTATVTFNDPVRNENDISYYDGTISGSIAITEANFDSADVVVSVTKDGESYPMNVAWNDNSLDIHTGTFELTEDGDYTVSIQYSDKSGNPMNTYASNQLTLDARAPTIEVSDIRAESANRDEKYGFAITVHDTNLDVKSVKPVLKTVQKTAEDVYKTVEIDLGEAEVSEDGQTAVYTVENLPEDGLYTLTCEAADMAGNTTATITLDDEKVYEQVQFSINRNGSAFGYGDSFTENLVAQYYTYSINEDIVVVEVNVDPIENFMLTLNGKELTEGSDYTTAQTTGDGQWSKRTYTVKKALFAEEGEYSIIVSSTDKTGTTAYSDIKNLVVSFVVDQTKPTLTISGLAAGGRYQTDAQTVTLIPTDEGGRLSYLSVVVLNASGTALTDENGNDISVRFEMSGEELLRYLEENDGKIVFTVPQGLNNQVRIICGDCAVNAEGLTNEYNELFERVTVSQNQLIIFYANTPVFIGTIVAVLAIIALIVVLIKRKSSKKAKAKA